MQRHRQVTIAVLGLFAACQTPLVIQRDDGAGGSAGARAGSSGSPPASSAGSGSGDGAQVGGEGGSAGSAAAGGAAGARTGGAGGAPTLGASGASGASGTSGLDPLVECENNLQAAAISAGEHHACAVEADTRDVYCWGLGSSGQLGGGDTESSPIPRRIQSTEKFIDVQVGTVSTCALSDARELYCFGDNFDGVLADGTSQGQSVPVLTASGVSTFAMSAGYVIANTDSGVLAWGSNTNGQLGLGNASVGTVVRTESWVAPGNFVALTAGYTHACALDISSGYGHCAGNNFQSRLGIPGGPRSTFTELTTMELKRISAGYDRSCAMNTLGELYCWGNNVPVTFEGLPEVVTTPTQLGKSQEFTYISVGFDHLCTSNLVGELGCTGDNSEGELGTPGESSASFVRPLVDFRSFIASAGRNFTCALRNPDVAVVCFGSNQYGKLGRGSDDEGPGAPALVCLPPP